MSGLCPECFRALEYDDQTVVARIDGRFREVHRACLPSDTAAASTAGPATVGGRMASILEADDEAGASPADQESAPPVGAVARRSKWTRTS